MQKRRRDKWRTLTRSFDDDAQRRSNLASGCNISLCQNMFYLTRTHAHTHTHTHGKISGKSNGHWNGTSSSHPSPNSKVPTPSLNQNDNLSFKNKKILKQSWNPQKCKIFQNPEIHKNAKYSKILKKSRKNSENAKYSKILKKSRKSKKYSKEFLKNCRKSWKNQSCESISCRLRNSYLQLRNLPSSLNQFRNLIAFFAHFFCKPVGLMHSQNEFAVTQHRMRINQFGFLFFKMNYWILSDWPNKSEPWHLRGFDVWKYLSVNSCGRYARNVSISPTQSTK